MWVEKEKMGPRITLDSAALMGVAMAPFLPTDTSVAVGVEHPMSEGAAH
jgi:hypothetical protein